ncbi:UDP-4-amino-4, 6-dideoxy-N-acetyl-beta-L-altrosamine N-acetyltransferase [Paenibacillus sp. LjRoot56]
MANRHSFQLRELAEDDLSLVLDWRNRDFIRSHMFTDRLISWEEHTAWFTRLKIEQSEDKFLIFEVEGTPLGLISFTGMDKRHNRCNWGFYIGEPSAPRGSGGIMCYLGLELMFEQYNLRKICGEVLGFNEKSIKIHHKLGFTQEGTLKRHLNRNGGFEDIIVFAHFKDEWDCVKEDVKQLIFLS